MSLGERHGRLTDWLELERRAEIAQALDMAVWSAKDVRWGASPASREKEVVCGGVGHRWMRGSMRRPVDLRTNSGNTGRGIVCDSGCLAV